MEYSLRHKKLVVVPPPPAFICTFTENPLLNFYCVKSGLEIDFQICNLLRRSSSSSTACFRRADAGRARTPAALHLPGSARVPALPLPGRSSIADAHELGQTRQGGSTWRPAIRLDAHSPTAPVLLPYSFSSASAAPSPSASAAPFGPCLAAAPEASPRDLRKLRYRRHRPG